MRRTSGSRSSMDARTATSGYLEYYDLERYLLDTVRPRFHQQGSLSALDFFCIIIWKANRAKTTIARKLLRRGYDDLEAAVRDLTTALAGQPKGKDRLRCLMEEWGLRLSMATAVLTILYPDEFTVYDARICEALGGFDKLGNTTSFEKLWEGYQGYREAVIGSTPAELSLRDKDRYLWAKSFHRQLSADVAARFAFPGR